MNTQDMIVGLKNEALALVDAGQAESDRMNEIIRELYELIQGKNGKQWATIARAALNRVAKAL